MKILTEVPSSCANILDLFEAQFQKLFQIYMYSNPYSKIENHC